MYPRWKWLRSLNPLAINQVIIYNVCGCLHSELLRLAVAACYKPFLSTSSFLPQLIIHFLPILGNVLTHIIYHLCRTENNLTKSDLCRALVCTMDFGGSCANDCFDFGLLGALQGVLLVGSHDLTVDAGMCVDVMWIF